MQKKILFVNHYAGRSGAPSVLLQVQQWLKEHTDIAFETVLLAGGGLLEDFRNTGKTTLCVPGKLDRYIKRLLVLCGSPADEYSSCYARFARRMTGAGIGLVYVNTIVNGKMLGALSRLRCPVICHVHEPESLVRFFGPENMALIKQHTTQYIAVSEKIKRNLMETHGIASGKIEVVCPDINIQSLTGVSEKVQLPPGIPQNAFIVCGSGQGLPWVKGKDFFVQLAYVIARDYPDMPIHFLWIGGTNEGMDDYLINHDIAAAGLSGRVHIVTDVANPLDYFNRCDVFVMVSREESFGLASIEAAALGKPVVCFEGASAVPDFVEQDAGCIVPYLDLDAMAESIIRLARDPELKKRLGARAAEKARQRCAASNACSAIAQIMQRFL